MEELCYSLLKLMKPRMSHFQVRKIRERGTSVTSSEYIPLVPEELGFNSVSVLIMRAKRRSPEGPIVAIFLPQFLPHCQKSEASFNLTSHVIRTETDRTHCYSCQSFGHIRTHRNTFLVRGWPSPPALSGGRIPES
jgi:hypothetical protein